MRKSRKDYQTVVPVPGYQPMVVEKLSPQQPKATSRIVHRLTIATADRHMQIIAKWEKLGYITKAKADALRKETIGQMRAAAKL